TAWVRHTSACSLGQVVAAYPGSLGGLKIERGHDRPAVAVVVDIAPAQTATSRLAVNGTTCVIRVQIAITRALQKVPPYPRTVRSSVFRPDTSLCTVATLNAASKMT